MSETKRHKASKTLDRICGQGSVRDFENWIWKCLFQRIEFLGSAFRVRSELFIDAGINETFD